MKNLFLTLMLCGSVFAAGMLSVSSITDEGNGTVTFSLDYMFEEEVGGFQFDLLTDGVVTFSSTAASGGDASGVWSVSSNNAGTVLGFSITGATMPAGSGHFLDITGTYDTSANGQNVAIYAVEDCDSDGVSNCNGATDTRLVLSDPSGAALESSFSTG